MPWTPLFAFPNLNIRTPSFDVECPPLAMVSWYDPRLTEIRSASPLFNSFCYRFKTTFGQRLRPAFMIRWDNEPANQSLRSAALPSSFRDLLSVCTIMKHQTLGIIHRRQSNRMTWSDYFVHNPWMTDLTDDTMVCVTPAMLSVDNALDFRGQSWPQLPVHDFGNSDLDESMLEVLIACWHQYYVSSDESHHYTALFRSLGLAHQAMLMPSQLGSFLELGRIISLWVSAFETLFHPGGNQQINWATVASELTAIRWRDRYGVNLSFELGMYQRELQQGNAAAFIYKQLYDARNSFLHGNPVNAQTFLLQQSAFSMLNIAPVLYRIALTKFLALDTDELPAPDLNNPEQVASHYSRSRSLFDRQYDAERALYLATLTPGELEQYDVARCSPRRGSRILPYL